jgi:hypothetical protein
LDVMFEGGQLLFRMSVRIFCLALILGMAGCATSPAQANPALQMEPASNVSGVWEGETRVIPCPPMNTPFGRCNAVNRITFVIRQDGSSTRGDYKCAIGTQVCRDANRTTSGEIVDGSVSGRTIAMRVLLTGDLSSCIYNGEVSSTASGGTYRCYQGGGLNEVGIWQVSRSDSSEGARKR